MTGSIDRYLQALGARLDLPAAERAAALEEVRAHLEEQATNLQAAGRDPLEAEQTAVGAFGDATSIARSLSATHAPRWGARRWLGGIGLGALLLWVIWILGSFPVLAYQAYTSAVAYPLGTQPSPYGVLIQATPLTSGGFFAYTFAGWLWLAPMIALYLVLPFVWGMRARSWWAPGLVGLARSPGVFIVHAWRKLSPRKRAGGLDGG